jgi:hypothetical protein
MHKYMKIGKRNGKRKKKRDFPANWAGGILAQPRHAWQAAQHGLPTRDDTGTAPWVRAHVPARRGNAVRGAMRGRGEPVEGSVAVLRRGPGSKWSGRWLSMGGGRGSWWRG